jgi:peptidoglycan-N-acetylmuramic acid deacetylase
MELDRVMFFFYLAIVTIVLPCSAKQVYVGCKDPGVAAITVDDGTALYTSDFLDYFQTENIKASFFVIGEHVQRHSPDLVKRIVADGHILGSHTWSHPHLSELSDDAIRAEMDQNKQLLNTILPDYHIRYMRPPYGDIDDRVSGSFHYVMVLISKRFNVTFCFKGVLNDMGYHVVNWNANSTDWLVHADPSTEAQHFADWRKEVQDIYNAREVGVITLHHDLYQENLGVLKNSVTFLRSKNYQFVTIDECLFPTKKATNSGENTLFIRNENTGNDK